MCFANLLCKRQIIIKCTIIKDISLHTFSFWHWANNRGNELAHLCALQTMQKTWYKPTRLTVRTQIHTGNRPCTILSTSVCWQDVYYTLFCMYLLHMLTCISHVERRREYAWATIQNKQCNGLVSMTSMSNIIYYSTYVWPWAPSWFDF